MRKIIDALACSHAPGHLGGNVVSVENGYRSDASMYDDDLSGDDYFVPSMEASAQWVLQNVLSPDIATSNAAAAGPSQSIHRSQSRALKPTTIPLKKPRGKQARKASGFPNMKQPTKNQAGKYLESKFMDESSVDVICKKIDEEARKNSSMILKPEANGDNPPRKRHKLTSAVPSKKKREEFFKKGPPMRCTTQGINDSVCESRKRSARESVVRKEESLGADGGGLKGVNFLLSDQSNTTEAVSGLTSVTKEGISKSGSNSIDITQEEVIGQGHLFHRRLDDCGAQIEHTKGKSGSLGSSHSVVKQDAATVAKDSDGEVVGEEVSSGATQGCVLESTLKENDGIPSVGWVLCDNCHKWRCIPSDLADAIESSNCRWTCKENPNKDFADCSIPQEKSNAQINAELNISEVSLCEEGDDNDPDVESRTVGKMPDRQPYVWRLIKHNIFKHRQRKTQTIDEAMVCHCKASEDGEVGCGEECLNRMLSIECVPGTCPCGDLCSNQQFQKRAYSKIGIKRCGKKGFGLQVLEDVSKGSFIIEYVGEVLDAQAYHARQKEYALTGLKHFYFMTLNNSEVIDACVKGNLGRFVNHSCQPNCTTQKWMVNGEVCVGLFALHDLVKGEEITFDYNFVRVGGAAAKKCRCGSSLCKGFIGGDPVSPLAVVESDNDEDDPEPIMIAELDEEESSHSQKNPLLIEEKQPILSESSTKKNHIFPGLKRKLSSAEGGCKQACRANPNSSSRKVSSTKNSRIGNTGDRFEGVEERLNDILDSQGGISKQKDAGMQYLKLLVVTAACGEAENEEACRSTRELSMVLDALIKTPSRNVLKDIISKNGLQLLHNIIKQNRENYGRTPIIRKLLKILEYLATKQILTLEEINTKSPCHGVESLRDTIFKLSRHADIEVIQVIAYFVSIHIKDMRLAFFYSYILCGQSMLSKERVPTTYLLARVRHVAHRFRNKWMPRNMKVPWHSSVSGRDMMNEARDHEQPLNVQSIPLLATEENKGSNLGHKKYARMSLRVESENLLVDAERWKHCTTELSCGPLKDYEASRHSFRAHQLDQSLFAVNNKSAAIPEYPPIGQTDQNGTQYENHVLPRQTGNGMQSNLNLFSTSPQEEGADEIDDLLSEPPGFHQSSFCVGISLDVHALQPVHMQHPVYFSQADAFTKVAASAAQSLASTSAPSVQRPSASSATAAPHIEVLGSQNIVIGVPHPHFFGKLQRISNTALQACSNHIVESPYSGGAFAVQACQPVEPFSRINSTELIEVRGSSTLEPEPPVPGLSPHSSRPTISYLTRRNSVENLMTNQPLDSLNLDTASGRKQSGQTSFEIASAPVCNEKFGCDEHATNDEPMKCSAMVEGNEVKIFYETVDKVRDVEETCANAILEAIPEANDCHPCEQQLRTVQEDVGSLSDDFDSSDKLMSPYWNGQYRYPSSTEIQTGSIELLECCSVEVNGHQRDLSPSEREFVAAAHSARSIRFADWGDHISQLEEPRKHVVSLRALEANTSFKSRRGGREIREPDIVSRWRSGKASKAPRNESTMRSHGSRFKPFTSKRNAFPAQRKQNSSGDCVPIGPSDIGRSGFPPKRLNMVGRGGIQPPPRRNGEPLSRRNVVERTQWQKSHNDLIPRITRKFEQDGFQPNPTSVKLRLGNIRHVEALDESIYRCDPLDHQRGIVSEFDRWPME